MERVLAHVAAGQRFIEGEHHRVVLGVGLVAALSDPPLVSCQRVVETPETGSEKDWRRFALIKPNEDGSAFISL